MNLQLSDGKIWGIDDGYESGQNKYGTSNEL